MDFIKLTDQLPPAWRAVLVQRANDYYLAYRKDKPLTTNPDASQDCYWRGSKLSQLHISDDTIFNCSFSDVTVLGWCELRPVIDKAENYECFRDNVLEVENDGDTEGYLVALGDKVVEEFKLTT